MVSVGDRVRFGAGLIPPHRCEGQTGTVIRLRASRGQYYGGFVQLDGGGMAFAHKRQLETIDDGDANGESS